MPAMPCSHEVTKFERGGGRPFSKTETVYNAGLTKREMFAMHAMQGFVAKGTTTSMIPKLSIEVADALLADLDKCKS